MSVLTVYENGLVRRVDFEGQPLLCELLEKDGRFLPHPCGKRGTCGKCAVDIKGELSPPDEAEIRAKTRLSCRVRLLGDAEIFLSKSESTYAEGAESFFEPKGALCGEYGVAADIGSTTLAVTAYQLSTGEVIGSATGANPQLCVSADVMGRLEHAVKNGADSLKPPLWTELLRLCKKASPYGFQSISITGNTVMLSLLCGEDVSSLATAPFEAKRLFGELLEKDGITAYLAPCASAFAGADLICAVLFSGMCEKHKTALLADIGTNAELALLANGKLYLGSVPAGPVFEGGEISCGCTAINGAVCRAKVENGAIVTETVNGEEAVGVCGSGLIDLIACLRAVGAIDESGRMEAEYEICEGVSLTPSDVRAFQTAKAAFRAALELLFSEANVKPVDIEKFYISGGFGKYVDPESAAAVGLFPKELSKACEAVGNGALKGASMALLQGEARAELLRIRSISQVKNFGGDGEFSRYFLENMRF